MDSTTPQYPAAIPAIWVFTSSAALNGWRREDYPQFYTPAQAAKVERIRQARMLFDNRHREFFLGERRSNWDFPPIRVGRINWQPYVPQNLLRLISWKGADLLFGQEPMLRARDKIQQKFLADLSVRSNLHQLFYAKAVDCSYEGEAFVESCIDMGEAFIREIPADEMFCVGSPTPDGQYRQYDRLRTQKISLGGGADVEILLRQSHTPGLIESHLYQLNDEGQTVREIDLKEWPLDVGAPALAEKIHTRIMDNTITWIPNQLVRGQPVSDYDGVIEMQDMLNAKNTQLDVAIYKHASPKLYVPSGAADDQGNFRSSDDVIFGEGKDAKPDYLTWDARLKEAQDDRDYTAYSLLQLAEMSPVLLGMRMGTHGAEAFRTIRVQAYNSTTKSARKASYFKNGIRRAVGVAQQLENTLPHVRYTVDPIGVEMQDGLPIDTLDLANELSVLRAAGGISLERMVERQIPDPEAAAKELELIEAENADRSAVISFAPKGSAAMAQATGENEEEAAMAAEADEMETVGA